jgi:hypothetical protein
MTIATIAPAATLISFPSGIQIALNKSQKCLLLPISIKGLYHTRGTQTVHEVDVILTDKLQIDT